jgi:hypothetical protein
MPTLPALDVFQVGIQSAFGTAVPATARLAVPEVVFRETGVKVAPRIAGKTLAMRNRGNEFVAQKGTDWLINNAPFCYEQFQVWLANAVAGGVTAVGASAPFTWTYTRDPAADPDPDPLTLERRVSDFGGNVDIEVADCFTRRLGLMYSENDGLRFSVDGFGRAVDDGSTLTGSQTLPTPEFAPSALLELYLNNAWADLGDTQLTEQVIGMEWDFFTGFAPRMTADGRATLDYTLRLLNAEEVRMRLSLTLLMDRTRYATEQAAAQAQTLRAIRATIAGTSSRALTWDGLFKYTSPDILELGMQDGQHVVQVELEETTDGTNFFEAVLVNATDAPDGV